MQDIDTLQAIFSIAVLIFSVSAHEASHGYMAQSLGDPTARLAGRLTLNPLKHLDLMGSIIVPFLMFISHGPMLGWAKPVPYNPYNLRDQKWGDAKVALAGPLTNLGIAFIAAMFLRFGFTHLTMPMISLLNIIITVNLVLAIFNLVPIPPLDGSKVLISLLPQRQRYLAHYLERYALVFMLIFVFFLWQFFLPLVDLVYRLFVGA